MKLSAACCSPRRFLALCVGIGLTAGAAHAGLPLVSNAQEAAALFQKAATRPTCAVADLSKAENGVLLKDTAETVLPPGRYRLHVPTAGTPLGTLALGLMRITLFAGAASRDFSILHLPQNDTFADLTLDFTVTQPGNVPVRVEWRAEEPPKSKGVMGKRSLEIHQAREGSSGPSLTLADDGAADEEFSLDAEGSEIPVAEARAKPFRLMASGAFIERRSPVSVTVETDKVVYRPGEAGHVTLTLSSAAAAPLKASYRLFRQVGLADPVELKTGTLNLEPGKPLATRFERLLDTTGLRWGAEIRAIVGVDTMPNADARQVFAVSSNLWEVGIIAAHPAHMAAFDDPRRAREAALRLRADGFTGFEAFFWAPCDLLEFTPDEELFFSGQTAYPGTVTGTKNLLQACHEQGLSGTFYANLWGGSGPPAMDVMRRHPDWFGNANYSTAVLDDWELLGPSQMDMGPRKIRAPGIATWCFNQLTIIPPEGVFRYHANEIIQSHRIFGWDGIRYDSYYSRYWSVRAMRLIRSLVEKDVPGFQFAYNSFAGSDHRALSLDDMVGGGGLIMAEGIRIERSRDLRRFLDDILSWRDLIWPYGGHGPGMLFRDGTDEEAMTPVGIEYEASLIFAGGGHLYYNPVRSELANYARFALRYSEMLYNNRMRTLKNPDSVVSVPPEATLLRWQPLARTVSLGGRRQRLVLHLVNDPVEANPFADKGVKAPAPLRNVPVTVTLPANATPTGAWWLHVIPDGTHASIPFTREGSLVRFTVPEIRFWSVAVLDFDADQPLPSPVTEKDKTDTYIQDWYLMGPFPNDLQMTATNTVYEPETRLDFAATCKGAGDRPLTWQRTVKPGAPSTGRLPLDFRDALPAHDNAPGCAYAYTEIESDTERTAALFGKADDTLALWVNGARVEFKGGTGEFQDVDEGKAVIRLQKGRNRVLAKVCEKWLYWLLALRLAEEDGTPLMKGVTISAGP